MIREYLDHLQNVKGLQPQTLDGYRKDLQQWVKWAKAQNLRWSTTTQADIESWQTAMAHKKLQPATRNRRLSALRGLLKWAWRAGILDTCAARYCSLAKVPEALPKPTNLAGIDNYLAAKKDTSEGAIAAVLVAVMVESGLRIGECQNVKLADIDTKAHTIRVTGKGNRERMVLYGKRTESALHDAWGMCGEWLCPRWHQQQIRLLIEGAIAPYVGHVTPHQLRHTFATEALNAGMKLQSVSTLMGHKHTTTTERYARLTLQTISNEYKNIEM